MELKLAAMVLGCLHICAAGPAITLQDLEVDDDMESVGSYVREVRAASPYHKSYESEGDGEIGYSRKKGGEGKKGYQHFDSFHKKAGDNYEFAKEDSFGHDNGDEGNSHAHDHHEEDEDEGAYSHKNEQRVKHREPRPKRNRQSEQYRSPQYEKYVEDPERKEESQSEPLEQENEEISEGDPDGNGGTEAHGHDKADYKLPQKYTYGSGEEYNF